MTTDRRSTLGAAAAIAALLLAVPGRPSALPLYTVTTSDGVSTVTNSYSKVSDSFDSMRRDNLIARFRPVNPSFDPDRSPLDVNVLARGQTFLVHAAANSPALTMTIPSIGFTGTFAGRTRDESVQQIQDWFKKNGGRFLQQLAASSAALSPVDPLAGNPNSLQARTVSTSFDRGFTRLASVADATLVEGAGEGAASNKNLASVSARFTSGWGDYRSQGYTLPIGYSWRFDDDARHQIALDLPITYQTVESGHVYSLGCGLGYSHPINRLWVLTAGVDYGITLSKDLGALGHLVTGTLTSLVTVPLTRGLLLHVGNLVGRSSTLPISAGDYSSDPQISNTVFRNGLMLYFSTARLLRSSGIELFAIDTRYLGSALYDNGYTEVGASLGLSRVTFAGGYRYDSIFRVGASWLFARNNQGLTVNLGYFF